MNKAVRLANATTTRASRSEKTKDEEDDDEREETNALRGWRGDSTRGEDEGNFETDGLGIIPSSAASGSSVTTRKIFTSDAVSDVAILDADEIVQERMAKQVRDMREKKKKKKNGDQVEGTSLVKIDEIESQQRNADLSKARVHAVPRGLMSSSSNMSGGGNGASENAIELIKKHEKHAKKAFRQAEMEREQAQKRLKKVREKKSREAGV